MHSDSDVIRYHHRRIAVSPLIALPIILAVVTALLIVVFALLLARLMVSPPRMTDGKALALLRRLSPGDLGLPFEIKQFIVRDEATGGRTTIPIAAWWIPAFREKISNRSVLLLHGFADAKVGAIAWAQTWRSLGFNVLAIDLRAHGESGGQFCTAGYFERHDVTQVVDQLHVELPDETRQLVLFGASYGAAIAIAVAAERDDLAGIVLDSPFGDFGRAVMTRAKQFGAGFTIVQALAKRVAQMKTGADFDAVRPVDLLERVKCPVLLIQPLDDRAIDPSDFDAVFEAMRRRANANDDVWQVEDTNHLLALAHDPDEYAKRIGAFVGA